MSNVVELKPRLRRRTGLARQIGAALGPAEILLFSGVRYERWDDVCKSPDDSQMKRGGGRRRKQSGRQ